MAIRFKGRVKFNILEATQYRNLLQMPFGDVYFVDKDHAYASDANRGTDPDRPLKKVQVALNKCTTNKNDYVFVLSAKDEDTTAITPTSQVLYRVHLIGVSNPQSTWGVVFRSTTDTEDAMYLAGAALSYGEIAGISFGGGATARGGIGLAQTMGLWIHHNVFGHSFCGDTPAYGIWNHDAANCEGTLIEDNFFFGDADNATGKLAQYGIYMMSATPAKNLIVRRNVFMSLATSAIYLNATGGMILDNRIKCDADTAGAGIKLGPESSGCWVDGNSANFGGTNAMTTNRAFVDDAAGGADANTWGANWVGNAVDFPS